MLNQVVMKNNNLYDKYDVQDLEEVVRKDNNWIELYKPNSK